MLFSLWSLPVSRNMINEMDQLQRKMIRRIVGWRRKGEESWQDTMRRMRERVNTAERQYKCHEWSQCFARRQWRYAIHLLTSDSSHWVKWMAKYLWSAKDDEYSDFVPHRIQGRPYLRWDDTIQKCCNHHYPQNHSMDNQHEANIH